MIGYQGGLIHTIKKLKFTKLIRIVLFTDIMDNITYTVLHLEDITYKVALYLNVPNMYSFLSSCSQFYKMMNNNMLWYEMCIKYDYSEAWFPNYKQQFRMCFVLNKLLFKCGFFWRGCPSKWKNLGLSLFSLLSLPNEIGELTNLERLVLGSNLLTSVPSTLGKLTNLQYLSLHNNRLETLPMEMSNLTNLHELHLSYNKLKSLPSIICQLTKLQVLTLHNNQLELLPLEIGNLTNLRELSLQSNQWRTLPAEIGNLINLRELSLDKKHIGLLPVSIFMLANLQIGSFTL